MMTGSVCIQLFMLNRAVERVCMTLLVGIWQINGEAMASCMTGMRAFHDISPIIRGMGLVSRLMRRM